MESRPSGGAASGVGTTQVVEVRTGRVPAVLAWALAQGPPIMGSPEIIFETST